MAEETEEHAKDRLVDIEAESADLRKKLASLREQWEAEKSGVGSVQELRQQLDEVEHEFERAGTQIKERQSAALPVEESLFQRLYELDVKRKGLAERLEQEGSER